MVIEEVKALGLNAREIKANDQRLCVYIYELS